MTDQMTISYEGDHILALSNGAKNYQFVVAFWTKVRNACAKHKCFDVLGIAETTVPIETSDALKIADVFGDLGIDAKFRIAWVEVNPATAEAAGLRTGDVVQLKSSAGEVNVPVLVYPGIRPDVIAMPIGQGHAESGRYAKGRGVNPMQLLAGITDDHTGDLAWAATRVKMTATGERISLAATSGHPRTLGRQILGPATGEHG